jgi:hypothetical protein
MSTTFRKNLFIDMSRTILPLRHGAATNQKSPTSKYLDHVHGPTYPLKEESIRSAEYCMHIRGISKWYEGLQVS